jgi:hypothetical protein
MAQDYTINVKVQGTGKVKQEIEGVGKSASASGELAGQAFGPLDGVLGGLPSKFMAARQGVLGLNLGFKGMKAAIASTGIGLLVVAIGEIAANWDSFTDLIGVTSEESRRLAEQQEELNRVMMRASAATEPYLAIIQDLNASMEDRQVAQDQLAKVVSAAAGIDMDAADGLERLQAATENYVAMQETQQRLAQVQETIDKKKEERANVELSWTQKQYDAQTRAYLLYQKQREIDKELAPLQEQRTAIIQQQIDLQKQMNAETERQRKEREKAAQAEREAQEAEREAEAQQQKAERERLARLDRESEAIARREEQAVQTGMTEEELFLRELERQEEAELALVDSEEAKIAIKEYYAQKWDEWLSAHQERQQQLLDRQADADEAKEKQRRDKLTEFLKDEETKERDAVIAKYDEMLALAEEFGYNEAELLIMQKEELAAIEEKYGQDDINRVKQIEEAKQALRQQALQGTFDILYNLTTAAEKDTEESAKQAFNRNKAISIAETLVNTYMAAQKAYASQIIPLDPTSVIRAQIAAGVAVASGLAKVAAIKSTQFNASGAAGGAATAGGSFGGGGFQSVGVDVGTLVPDPTQTTPEPVRAYVVSNEISNQQALDRELQIQTTL